MCQHNRLLFINFPVRKNVEQRFLKIFFTEIPSKD